MKSILLSLVLIASLFVSPADVVAQSFSDLVGDVSLGRVDADSQIRVPFIVWGGDVATFHANRGIETQRNSIFDEMGLNIKLTPGDDFAQQVRDYISGKSPFLRGTFRMIGMASEVIAANPATRGVVLFQMTWSAGDHAVSRAEIRTIRDLKGAKVCLQRGGPHEGFLDDLLNDAGLSWSDIDVVWAEDLTGSDNSPAEMFRNDSSIDVAFVISPDMLGLTSGLQSVGSGLEGTVKGARVLVSTADRSRSIADVYVVRQDFFEAHRDWCKKFTAGYLKAAEQVVELKSQYESVGSSDFENLLTLAQSIYGEDVLPTIEEDAYGLVDDCSFVGHPGNVRFFTDESNITGFAAFNKSALDLAQSRGYASTRADLIPSPLDWGSSAITSHLTKVEAVRQERFRAEAVMSEIEALNVGGQLDDSTIYEFSINFEPNQEEFSASQYGVEFQRVVELSARYANSVIAVRGHSDPSKVLLNAIRAGMQKGILKRTGTTGNYSYFLNGRPLDLNSTEDIVKAIERGDFDGVPQHNPRETMQAALNLSRMRAESVRSAIIDYASSQGLELDPSQIQPSGVGVSEPLIPRPTNMNEAGQNMRVEFRLIRITAEVMHDSAFDF